MSSRGGSMIARAAATAQSSWLQAASAARNKGFK